MTVRVLAALLVLTVQSSGPNVDVSNLPGAQSETAITIDPTNDRALLAGSNSFPEGTMRAYGSTDGGETWQDHRPGAQRDVHSLAWHPRAEGRAYEAGGGGPAFSEDAGESWRPADDGLDRRYTWAVAVDPDDPGLWYVSASTGPFAAHGGRDPQARLFRRGAGEPWSPLADGLPEPLPAMPYALVAAGGRLFAGLADGQIWESRDRGDSWRALRAERMPGLRALAWSSS